MPHSRLLVAASIATVLTGCGRGHEKIEVTQSFDEARARFDQSFVGQVELDDGAELSLYSAHELKGWVCGEIGGEIRDVCFETSRARTVRYEEIQTGQPSLIAGVVTLAITWPILLAYWDEDRKNANADQAEKRRQAKTAAPAAQARLAPSPPTASDYELDQQFYTLANCMKVKSVDRDATSGAELADQVWRDGKRCAVEASAWFKLNRDVERARRLMFVGLARDRFERIRCQTNEEGLRAPKVEDRWLLSDSWMQEFRAVVEDPSTYDYAPEWQICRSLMKDVPTPSDQGMAEAQKRAVSGFPLTELPAGGGGRL
jgi:hypothetical protein